MVIVTLLNFLFIGQFMILVKLIYQEITVKLSQKASGILLSSKLNFNETILILNLKQILLVWISITMIKLGEFNPFPGKDFVLVSVAVASIKILNSSKEVLVADLCSALSILIMGVVIGVQEPRKCHRASQRPLGIADRGDPSSSVAPDAFLNISRLLIPPDESPTSCDNSSDYYRCDSLLSQESPVKTHSSVPDFGLSDPLIIFVHANTTERPRRSICPRHG